MRRILAAFLALGGGLLSLMVTVGPLEAGGGGHGGCTQKPQEGANRPVVIRNSCFTPTLLYVEQGSTVTWTNEDEVQHNAVFLDDSRAGGASYLEKGQSARQTFDAVGLFVYYCSLHPSMVGVVVVGDLAAATAAAQGPVDSQAASGNGQHVESATTASGSGGDALTAGLVVGVGLVSAGGGFLLRRRQGDQRS
jgi:plastocyanin